MSELRGALVRAAEWLWRRTDRRGALRCRQHRVEHTGKNASAMLLEMRLFEEGEGDRFLDRAVRRAERVVSMLRRDPAAGAVIFWPGRLRPWNAATSLIDGGSCARGLARLLERHRGALGEALALHVEDGLRRHLDEYLCNAVRIKEVPAQKLWGAAGLAAASRPMGGEAWREAALACVDASLGEQAPDGSFAYYPRWREYGAAEGLADPSSFYQSRHLGFAMAILEDLGLPLEGERRERVRRGLAFLAALDRGDGIKELGVEAKTYYWEGPYEVASHVFDVHALVMWRRATGDGAFRGVARRLRDQWVRHVAGDGDVRSHLEGPVRDFQCPVFWASHACWIAEVLGDAEADEGDARAGEGIGDAVAAGERGGRAVVRIERFPSAGLVRVEGERWVALLRGRKHPVSLTAGGAGGGGLLSVTAARCPPGSSGRGGNRGGRGGGDRPGGMRGRGTRGWRVRGWDVRVPGTFLLRPARPPSLADRLRAFRQANRGELRFRLWVAKGELRAGRPGAFLLQLVRRALFRAAQGILSDAYTAHWALDARLEVDGTDIRATCRPANRWGHPLGGVVARRRYHAGAGGLEVVEELRAVPGLLRSACYVLPPGAAEVEVEGEIRIDASRSKDASRGAIERQGVGAAQGVPGGQPPRRPPGRRGPARRSPQGGQ